MARDSKLTTGQVVAAAVVVGLFGAFSWYMVINTGWSLVPPGADQLLQSSPLLLMSSAFAATGITLARIILGRPALSAWLLLALIPLAWGSLLSLGLL